MLAPRAVKRKVNASKTASSQPAAGNDVSKSEDAQTTAEQQYRDMLREEEEYHRQSALEASSSHAPAAANGTASTSKVQDPVEEEHEEDPVETAKKQAEKLARLRTTLEETLSDWGLCHNRELMKRLESSKTGCTPLYRINVMRRLLTPFPCSRRSYIESIGSTSCL